MARAGAQVVIAEGMDAAMIQKLFSVPEAFVSMCQIVRENETTGYLDPTPTQVEVIRAVEANRWTFVNKYRQAKATTVVLMHLLLRDCMYLRGVEGVLIADTNATAEMAFRRIRFAYQNLPSAVKMPLAKGSKGSKREIEFVHGGRITIKSLEGRAPAVGHSIDRLHITELGEAIHQQKAIINLFPGINKRPNAKLVIESTPGKAGSYHERMWHEALRGEGQFHPLFLKWWLDKTCQIDPPDDFDPSEEELEYMGRHPGMNHAALYFRRTRLSSEFVGDNRLFSSKYPSDAHDGWLGADRPRMPEDIVREQLSSSQIDPEEGMHGCGVFSKPIEGRTYELYADPAGFGATGDPCALTVFDKDSREEVAVWSGREDPDRFAVRIDTVCSYYNKARAVVESNHAGCITALKELRTKICYSKRQPGWYATAIRIAKAEFMLVKLLREHEITIKSRPGLQQLLRYDGNFSKRAVGEDGIGHHFDRARTYIMAAEMLAKHKGFRARVDRNKKTDTTVEGPQEVQPGMIPFNLLNRDRDKMRRRDLAATDRPPKLR